VLSTVSSSPGLSGGCGVLSVMVGASLSMG
jgi:hypothetical protein